MFRILKQFPGCALLHQIAIVHEDDPAGHLFCESHLMGHDYHGHAFVGQNPDQVQDLSDHLWIQRGGRFIKKHDSRIHGQGADDGDPLLLTAGKSLLIDILFIFQTDPLEQADGLGFDFVPDDLC